MKGSIIYNRYLKQIKTAEQILTEEARKQFKGEKVEVLLIPVHCYKTYFNLVKCTQVGEYPNNFYEEKIWCRINLSGFLWFWSSSKHLNRKVGLIDDLLNEDKVRNWYNAVY